MFHSRQVIGPFASVGSSPASLTGHSACTKEKNMSCSWWKKNPSNHTAMFLLDLSFSPCLHVSISHGFRVSSNGLVAPTLSTGDPPRLPEQRMVHIRAPREALQIRTVLIGRVQQIAHLLQKPGTEAEAAARSTGNDVRRSPRVRRPDVRVGATSEPPSTGLLSLLWRCHTIATTAILGGGNGPKDLSPKCSLSLLFGVRSFRWRALSFCSAFPCHRTSCV